jgi:CheY-like chemotaxis protein
MAGTNVIFLAEDNPGDVALFKLALQKHEVPCTLAIHNDGASALSAIDRAETVAENERPDLFVLDLNLGHVGGIALLKRVRESPIFNETPVVIWTTSDSEADRQRSEQFGASRHICKPVYLEDFLKLGALFGAMLEGPRQPDLTTWPH